jgi:deazaflavin-dependent oxidoreductase (nitroreductase family)
VSRAALIARFTNVGARTVGRRFSRLHSLLNRATRGRLFDSWFGAPVLVLETTGRKTGRVRRVPVLYLRDGDSFVVVASNGGLDRFPAWWLNLEASGRATVELDGDRREVRARPADREAAERYWHELVRVYPPAREYRGFTDRAFPIVVLE